MSLLLDGAGLEVQYPARVLRLLGAELLADLLHILGVDIVIHARPVPFTLQEEIHNHVIIFYRRYSQVVGINGRKKNIYIQDFQQFLS